MSSANRCNLGCRHCRYYRPEGQRGGHCQMLSVPVRGVWPACSLVVPPFAPTWEIPEKSTPGQRQQLHQTVTTA